ncbi:MAG: NAD(P)H-binding protein [Pseudomonadales bacterium]|nr:NAD(P)H-binding protein [Pseudomonadales bacterium]
MTEQNKWMIYGATGYTGNLVIQEAIARGHKPILAGRNAQKLAELANRYQLETVTIDLEDEAALAHAVAAVDLVFHVAGPYIYTAEAMMQACLKGNTHYVDITGEAPVFKRCFELSEQAKEAGVAFVSGIGFDVIPTDCLLSYVASQIDDLDSVEMAIDANVRPSPGTLKSALGIMRDGKASIRVNGNIEQVPLGNIVKKVKFPSSEKSITLAPIADVYTAYYSTGAKNIKVFIAQPTLAAKSLKYFSPFLKLSLSSSWIVKKLENAIDRYVKGSDIAFREKGYAEVWAKAENKKGDVFEAGLHTGEVYYLTAQLSVRFIETLFQRQPCGAFAPAQLFSMQDLLAIEGVNLFDSRGALIDFDSELTSVANID